MRKIVDAQENPRGIIGSAMVRFSNDNLYKCTIQNLHVELAKFNSGNDIERFVDTLERILQ